MWSVNIRKFSDHLNTYVTSNTYRKCATTVLQVQWIDFTLKWQWTREHNRGTCHTHSQTPCDICFHGGDVPWGCYFILKVHLMYSHLPYLPPDLLPSRLLHVSEQKTHRNTNGTIAQKWNDTTHSNQPLQSTPSHEILLYWHQVVSWS